MRFVIIMCSIAVVYAIEGVLRSVCCFAAVTSFSPNLILNSSSV